MLFRQASVLVGPWVLQERSMGLAPAPGLLAAIYLDLRSRRQIGSRDYGQGSVDRRLAKVVEEFVVYQRALRFQIAQNYSSDACEAPNL